MKRLGISIVFILTLATACSQVTSTSRPLGSGVADGNNGGGRNYQSNPWFLGEAPVTYCIDKSDDFSLSTSAARQVVSDVISSWVKAIPLLRPDPAFRTLPVINSQPVDLSLNFVERDCSQALLKIRLGGFDETIDEALRLNKDDVVSFAYLTTYDIATARGRGFIWVAPDRGPHRFTGQAPNGDFWQNQTALFNTLIHEFGHVFGLAHDSMTFMAPSFPLLALNGAIAGRIEASYLAARSVVEHDGLICGHLSQSSVKNTPFDPSTTTVCIDLGTKQTITTFDASNTQTGQWPLKVNDKHAQVVDVSGLYPNTAGKDDYYEFLNYDTSCSVFGKFASSSGPIPMMLEMSFDGYIMEVLWKGTWNNIELKSEGLDFISNFTGASRQ